MPRVNSWIMPSLTVRVLILFWLTALFCLLLLGRHALADYQPFHTALNSEGIVNIKLADNASYLAGPDAGELTLDELLSGRLGEGTKWQELSQLNPPLLDIGHLWIRTKVSNNSNQPFNGVILIDEPGIFEIDIAITINGRPFDQHTLGSSHPFLYRPIVNRNYVVPILIPPGEQATIYFRTQGHYYLNKIYLFDNASFYYDDVRILMSDWLCMGMGLLVSLMALMAALIIRSPIYLKFFAFNTSLFAFLFSYEGYGYQILYPHSPWLAERSNSLTLLSSLFFGVLFSEAFLDLGRRTRYGKPIIIAMLAPFAITAVLVIALPVEQTVYLSIIAAPAGILCMLSLWVYSISQVGKKDYNSRVFALCGLLYIIPLGTSTLLFYSPELHYLSPYAHFRWGEVILAVSLFAVLMMSERRKTIAREKALTESEARSVFLAQVSHEIRTPMNGILGISELLTSTELDRLQTSYVRLIKNSCMSLLGVVNDILDYSKLSSTAIELESVPVSPQEMVTTSVQLFGQEAMEKGVDLVSDIDGRLPPLIQGDPTRLQQILNNLVSNAVKFTAAGNVSIGIRQAPDKTNFVLEVSDTGIGINKEQLDSIFKEFQQADVSTTRRYGGTGLGLSICQQLVSLLDGNIEVNSTLGKGSTFRVFLPLIPAQGNKANQDYSGLALKMYGFEDSVVKAMRRCLSSEKGSASIELIEDLESSSHQTFSSEQELVSLFYVRSPNHLEDARLVKLLGQCSGEAWFITSSLEMVEKIQNQFPGRPAYFAHALSAEIAALIRSIVDAHLFGDNPDIKPLQQESRRFVYAAEDNPVNQQVLKGMLSKLGYDSLIFDNGKLLLDHMQGESAQPENLAAILLDLEMPVMDGISTAQQLTELKQSIQLPDLPVIAVTAHTVPGELERCKSAGFGHVIIKPFTLSQLGETLQMREQT